MALGDERSSVEVPRRFARPWLRSQRPIPRTVVRPLERFLREEAGSGKLDTRVLDLFLGARVYEITLPRGGARG